MLEEMLQELLSRTVPALSGADQQSLTQSQQEVGKGKSIAELTLGQVVGVIRTAKFFPLAEKVLGSKLVR